LDEERKLFADALRTEAACLEFAAEELEQKGFIEDWAWTIERPIPEKYLKPKGAKPNGPSY
jgi:hypothetical protein